MRVSSACSESERAEKYFITLFMPDVINFSIFVISSSSDKRTGKTTTRATRVRESPEAFAWKFPK